MLATTAIVLCSTLAIASCRRSEPDAQDGIGEGNYAFLWRAPKSDEEAASVGEEAVAEAANERSADAVLDAEEVDAEAEYYDDPTEDYNTYKDKTFNKNMEETTEKEYHGQDVNAKHMKGV